MDFSKTAVGRPPSVEAANLIYTAEILTTLGSGHCFVIAAALRGAGRTIQQLCLATGLSFMQVAANLAHLNRSGIAVASREGAVVTYQLTDERFGEVIALAERLWCETQVCEIV